MQGYVMNKVKDEVKEILERLPDDCTIEDIQYHLYVVEKIKKGINRAEEEGTYSHAEIEEKYEKWISE
jgi:hypothetical protein